MIEHFERVHNVVHQDDDGRFSPDDIDVFIINTLAMDSPKPVWVTADLMQRREPLERAALRDSGMCLFFFRGIFGQGKDPHFQSLKVLSVWPRMVELAERAKQPTAFEIPCGKIGKLHEKIEPLGPTAELFKRA